jgi:hypothetical protein
MKQWIALVGVVTVGALLVQAPVTANQTTARSLGSVQVLRRATAGGEVLAPGTYMLRVTTDAVTPVVGQTPEESAWVEFLQGGKVKARAMATVLTAAQLKAMKKGGGPASGAAQSVILKGNEYLRIWVNRGGTNYLIHLALAPKS